MPPPAPPGAELEARTDRPHLSQEEDELEAATWDAGLPADDLDDAYQPTAVARGLGFELEGSSARPERGPRAMGPVGLLIFLVLATLALWATFSLLSTQPLQRSVVDWAAPLPALPVEGTADQPAPPTRSDIRPARRPGTSGLASRPLDPMADDS